MHQITRMAYYAFLFAAITGAVFWTAIIGYFVLALMGVFADSVD